MKPFKGIIRNWDFNRGTGRIHGICVMHTTYENGVERNGPITTSEVQSIQNLNGTLVCNTKNSVYILQ